MAASVTFLERDTTTQGSWIGTYGAAGYMYHQSSPQLNLPVEYSYNDSGVDFFWQWTTDVRGIQNPSDPNGQRVVSCIYNSPHFDVDIRHNSVGAKFQVALYSIDINTHARRNRIDAYSWDAGASTPSGTVAAQDDITVSMNQGIWSIFEVTEGARFRIVRTGSYNSMISFLAIDPVAAPSIIPKGSIWCPKTEMIFTLTPQGIMAFNPYDNTSFLVVERADLFKLSYHAPTSRVYASLIGSTDVIALNTINGEYWTISLSDIPTSLNSIPNRNRIAIGSEGGNINYLT